MQTSPGAARDLAMIERISRHPVLLPLGQGTRPPQSQQRPFSQGEKDRMRGGTRGHGQCLHTLLRGNDTT